MSDITEQLTKKMIYLWSDARKGRSNIFRDESKFNFISNEKGYFSLGEKGVECLNETIFLLKNEFDKDDQLFSEYYLRNLIRDLIMEILPFEGSVINSHAEKTSKRIIDELTAELANFMIVIPLTNFNSELDAFTIGKVLFTKFNIEKHDFIKKMRKREEKPIENILRKYGGKVVAEIKVSAIDNKKAQEIAISQIELALDVIRFYCLNLYFEQGTFLRNYFDLEGRVISSTTPIISYSLDNESGSFSSSRVGSLYTFEYSKEFHEIMGKLNFSILDDILKKDDTKRTNFENRIISAIRLAGSSYMSYDHYDAVLKMIISLESLLLNDRESKKDNLSERLSLIIADNYDDRLKVYKIMGELYEVRSEIVHQGNIDVNIRDRNQLQYFAFICLTSILQIYKKENIENIEDLITWIFKLKFSKI